MRRSRVAACTFALLAGAALPAQQLALRTYTVLDGLAHGRVNCVHQDHRGYLWFGTWDGLSRFDGVHFVNYGTVDGLPNPFVSCIVEDGDGRLWIGTLGGGIARMLETADGNGKRFEAWPVASTPRANDVASLFFAANGPLWIVTSAGIYRAQVQPDGVRAEPVLPSQRADTVGVADAAGALHLFAGASCVVVRGAAVATEPCHAGDDDGGRVCAVGCGRELVLAREHGLWSAPQGSVDATAWQRVAFASPSNGQVTALAEGPGGTLWVGTTQGLFERRDDGWCRYGAGQGLPDDWIRCLFFDREQVLWIGTQHGGLSRLADLTAVRFGAAEGFGDRNVARIVETVDGCIYASTDTSGVYEVFDDRVVPVPHTHDADFAHVHLRLTCDRHGDFWIGTEHGLWFCDGPRLDFGRARRQDGAVGLTDDPVCASIVELADGSVWFGSGDLTVHRLAAGAATWQSVLSIRPLGDPTPCRLVADDDGGSVLLATFDNLWRYDGQHCRPTGPAVDGPLRPRCVLRDSRGWRWIGTRFLGVFVERPESAGGVLHLSSRDGLASDAVWSAAEDHRGRIYLGTARGITCFDADTGRLRPFGGAGRLAGDIVNHILCDRRGRLWAGTTGGLSRFDLDAPERVPPPPTVYLASVQIDGQRVPTPENGASTLTDLVLSPDQRTLEVECVGLHFQDELPLRYQHRLEGADGQWSPPSSANQVKFANLAAGEYRFLVRAIDTSGRVSDVPATLAFTVMPPFWVRAWFLATVAAAAAAMVWTWHRARLRRAVATERLRTEIATDLHDEVGAGLAQIAILSEVARQRAEPVLASGLGEIAGLARTLREAMSDIVWALAKGHDRLADLVQRMRQLTTSMLEVDGTQVVFLAPEAAGLDNIALSIDQRRQLWLWFKEAVTNVARHADARRVAITLAVESGRLRVRIEDDGVGFSPPDATAGNGLPSLERRCARLGGSMELRAAPGAGTQIALEIPLQHKGRPA
ncbi:MAG TPA: two-component regulator propeller domain-containing protein [Planctomycetota bacterium]|nr:two-component regulator propeller domain-containing protein [Planctomycetota bacterium]